MTLLRLDVVRREPRRTTSVAGVLLLALSALVLGFAAAPAAGASPGLSPAAVQAQQWWLNRLNLRKAWTLTEGAGVTVAVLDSGINVGFGDLRGAVVPGFVPGGSGSGLTDTDPAEHGTRLADEIAGRGTGFGLLGVAPKATVLPVVVPTSDIHDATITALDRLATMAHPPQVANMAYGASAACPPDVQAAVRRAVDRGIILVASAGNEGATTNPSNYPANCAGVVAVSAVDQNGHVWTGSERQAYVALAAPGVHMIGYDAQAASGYGYADGTSDSAAIVSGVFALLRAHFPAMPARQLVARALFTAKQFLGAQGSRNDQTGFGVALPYDALTVKVPLSAPNPVYDALGPAAPSAPATPSASASSQRPGSSGPAPAPSSSAAGAPSASSGGGVSTAVIAAIIIAVLVVALVAVLLLRRRRSAPAGSGPPGANPWPPGPPRP